METSQLHCGACMENFETMDDLNSHLEKCHAAKNLLPLIYQLWGGNDKTGHPLSHYITSIHKNTHLIKMYAHSVCEGIDNLTRSKIHHKLCDKLNIEYNNFRPFESSEIKESIDIDEAEKILWEALFMYAVENLIERQKADSPKGEVL